MAIKSLISQDECFDCLVLFSGFVQRDCIYA